MTAAQARQREPSTTANLNKPKGINNMLIRQLSVFLENRNGKFAEIARLLGDNGINMRSFNVSETEDFGLARIIVSRNEVDRAFSLLKAGSYAVSIAMVIYLHCPDKPGVMADAMTRLAEAGISIDYMYAFAEENGSSNLIIRTDNQELANQILSEI